MSNSGLITGIIAASAGNDDPTIYDVTIEVEDSATATDAISIAWTVNDVTMVPLLGPVPQGFLSVIMGALALRLLRMRQRDC